MNPKKRKKLTTVLRKEGNKENFNETELSYSLKRKPKIPPFPATVLSLAILKDSLDLLDLTVIGIIATTIFSILFTIFLFIWTLKRGVGLVTKRIFKIVAKFIALLLLDFIPFIKILPFTVVYVVLVYNSHTKVVKALVKTILFIEGELKREDLTLEEFFELEDKKTFSVNLIKDRISNK